METSIPTLPNEILYNILLQLNRFELKRLIPVNKQFRDLARYVLENKKKIRVVADHLRVLMLGLHNEANEISVPSKPSQGPTNSETTVSRAFMISSTLRTGDKVTEVKVPAYARIVMDRERITPFDRKKADGKRSRITLIEASTMKRYRQKLWSQAIKGDVCLLIVDPQEIDNFEAELKNIILGSCYMMSSRNIIVSIDLHRYPNESTTVLNNLFMEAREKISKLVYKTTGAYADIIPVDSKQQLNVLEKADLKFPWFKGPSLITLLYENQDDQNFDENAYKKLCELPLKVQVLNGYRILGIGTVVEARVMSGVLKNRDPLFFEPAHMPTLAFSMEVVHESISEALPGDWCGINLKVMRANEANVSFATLINADQFNNGLIDLKYTQAFRARLTVLEPERLRLHQVFTVFYGPSKIRCILLWILPDDNKNHDKSERKCKVERHRDFSKAVVHPKSHLNFSANRKARAEFKADAAITYERQIERERQEYIAKQLAKSADFKRPPKKLLKSATVVLLPLVRIQIEPYKASEFAKNYTGKVMMIEKEFIVAAGYVNKVIDIPRSDKPLSQTEVYKQQYKVVVDQASSLFNLPTEKHQLALFLDHAQNNEHAKKVITSQKPSSFANAY